MNEYTNAYAARLETSQGTSRDTSKGKGKALGSAPPEFAAVELVTVGPPKQPPVSGPAAPPGVTISLTLPNGVETAVSGLDSDTATLLMLEIVAASTKPLQAQLATPACLQ